MSFIPNIVSNTYSYCVGAFISQDEKDDKLLAAAKKKDLNNVQALIIQGANPNIQDAMGNTPLLFAIEMGSTEIARFLINNGAHPDVYGKSCSSPLCYAISRGNQEIAKLLIERGALLKGFSSSEGGSKYTVCDTDDPCDILLLGTEIHGSCQAIHNNYSGLNRGLLGPLLDGKYRVIAVKNERGQMVARCLLKILWDEKGQTPVLFQERVYTYNEPNNSVYHTKLLNEMCQRKAQEMGVPLVAIGRGGDGGERYPNPVESLGGRSHVEYVDALSGINRNTYSISNSIVIWQP